MSPLHRWDWFIINAYFAGALLVGLASRRRQVTATSMLNASRTLPLWMAALSFLASNCGALELVGLAAVSAQYGVVALDYYWIGAVPALLFLALYMLPVYMRSKAASVPDFLGRRFNQQARRFNAGCVLVLSTLLAGISLYAMARILDPLLGWGFIHVAALATLVVVLYLLLGGLRASILNEILQLGLIVAAIAPLSILLLRESHGVRGLLADPAIHNAHLWTGLPFSRPSGPADAAGVVFGLGFVLAFGYWSTDFRLMQRALSLESPRQAPFLPLIAAAGKLVFPLLVVVPGLAATRLFSPGNGSQRAAGRVNYDLALTAMIERRYPHGMLGLGVSALLAALMSALAGNIAAAAAVWTQDLYRPWLQPGRSEKHYILTGRASTAAAALLGLASAFVALHFGSLMDYIQFIFSLFAAPLFAVVLLGMFTSWATPAGGFWGLLLGTAAGCMHNLAARLGLLHYGSQMTANFHGAIYAWAAAMLAVTLVSTWTPRLPAEALESLLWRQVPGQRSSVVADVPLSAYLLSALIAAACIALNILYA